MYRYKCPACEGNQYSASENKGSEPCVYCGNEGTEIMDNLEEDSPSGNKDKQD